LLYLSEKYIFALAILASGYITGRGFFRIYRIIRAGQDQPNWKLVPGRIGRALAKFISLAPTWKTRLSTSIFHALIAWGFSYYLLVNLEDVLSAYQPEFKLFGNVLLGNLFRLGADLFSIATIVGVLYMITRRFHWVIASKPCCIRKHGQVLHGIRPLLARSHCCMLVFALLEKATKLL